MGVKPEIKITFDERPLDVLNRLIEKRAQWMHESARDAVVATAIDALKSIRAASASAYRRRRFKFEVQDTGWYGGYSQSTKRLCFREGVSGYSRRIDVEDNWRVKWFIAGVPQSRRHVYLVTPEHKDVKPYYVVAQNPGVARAFEESAARHRTDERGGLAKNALGVAMGKLSTRGSDLIGSDESRLRASTLALVEHIEGTDASGMGEDSFRVHVRDELDYAMDALKGGTGAIEVALAKAANKVTSIIKRRVGASWGDTLPIPFPEVKRRR